MNNPDAAVDRGGPEQVDANRSQPAAPGSPAVLQMVGIEKRYGAVRALRNANLEIPQVGTVHALMGENGSGKSTLLRILCGEVTPDAGRLSLAGAEVTLRGPGDALAHGIAMVSQETHLAPDLSVAENVLMGGRMVRGSAGIMWSATRRHAAGILAQLELDYDPRQRTGDLRPDQQQMVEIARALSFGARILILDEPTSSLGEKEVQSLFRAIDRLRTENVSVVFVSHRLDEVLEISDDVTILRDGRTVESGSAAGYTPDKLVQGMVGDVGSMEVGDRVLTNESGEDPVLRTRHLSSEKALKDVSLQVRAGEIVGVAGLAGSGRSELLETLFGMRAVTGGSIELHGHPRTLPSPRAAVRRGIAYLPPERKRDALVGSLSVSANLTVVDSLAKARFRPPGGRAERETFDRGSRLVSLRAAAANARVDTLSGGNQQKVAIGKWLVLQPDLLLLDEPTRGVDVAAKAEIHHQIREASDAGTAVLVGSSEYRELLDLCDRIVVLFGGAVVGELARHEGNERVLAAMGGGSLDGS